MWLIITEGLAAVYLVGGGLAMHTSNFSSALFFKIIPMAIGLPLAFGVVAQLLGWPI